MDDGDEQPPKRVRATSPADGGSGGGSSGASGEGGGSGGGDACTEGKDEGGKEPGPTKKLRTGGPSPTITIRIKDQVRLALRPAELSRN